MAPIPYALSYHTTATNSVPKLVACEQCGFEYVYYLTATARGAGTSLLFLDNEGAKQRSQAAAEADLAAALESGCAVVPCPACGHVQEHMIPEARRRRHQWMRLLYPFLLGGGIILFVVTCGLSAELDPGQAIQGVMWTVTGLSVGLGVGLPFLRVILSRRYDPNADPVEKRKQLGHWSFASKNDHVNI